jgi:hypothetical protein
VATVALVSACLLGETLVWSGAAKAARLRETAAALVSFRLMKRRSRRAAVVVSAFEIVAGLTLVASALVGTSAVRWVFVAVALLFVGMAALVFTSLRRGDVFACMCFGSPDTALSATTLARTMLLAVIAVSAAAMSFGHDTRPSVTTAASALVLCGALLGSIAVGAGIERIGDRIDPFDFGDESGLVVPKLNVLEELQ